MLQQNITETLTHNYMPYSVYVILHRALPEIDGLKPSQRRILYTMYKMGLLSGARKKSQGVVGQTMFLHPHGDMAIYETLVKMSRDNQSMSLPYIDSKGNFGKVYSRDTQFASARYTEVRLEEIAKELFKDINKNMVDMVDNYDGSLKEPRLLPVTFPSILTNATKGIANGMASSFAPFNISEVIDYTIAYIKDENADVHEYIKAPDFPTGENVIYDEKVFKKIYETGKGSFRLRATYRFEKNAIIFEKLPYSTTFEVIIEKIISLVKEGKIKDIVDINDIYGINSEGIQIDVKANTNKELLVERLFKLTPLESTYDCNFNMVVNKRPQLLGIKQIIKEWVNFRTICVKRGLLNESEKKSQKKHLLVALKKVLEDLEKAIEIIRYTPTNSKVVENLIEAFGIEKDQAEFVAEIKLKNLNEEYFAERIKEIETLSEEIKELDDLISNESELAKVIIQQLEETKRLHGKERQSQVISVSDLPKVQVSKVEIDEYNVKIFVTKEGYLKKIPLTGLRGNNVNRVKDGDEIVSEIETTNNSEILVFTDKQNVYRYRTYELEDHKTSVLGEYLPSLLELEDENIVFVTATNDYRGDLLIGFTDGKMARIKLDSYQSNYKQLKKAYAPKEAVYWRVITGDIDILAVSSIDKALIFNTSKINVKKSKNTEGVQVMKSKNDSYVRAYHELEGNESYHPVVEDEYNYYYTASAGVGKYLREGDFQSINLH
ncbi:DNA gyrase/topoisomerase IV subunit A [Priestia megaterium]|uniref:DNA gyrase/topoisomerase IV subunit A n=1 Tax=Priestia megaterium TaxID=1404 RepID=UPI000BFC8DF1|nr:DNA topoisomerase (ATP-hydrolyzing) subunit A [Priestia megaterium]PGO60568.1 topoisomerase IV [Priestia megaterium]